MTDKEEFINFFKTNPEIEQLEKSNMENKIMKNTKQTTVKVPAKRVKAEKVKVEGGFELSNNIPMPDAVQRKGIKSPFRKTVEVMKIGQHFDTDLVPKHRYSLEKKLNVKLITEKLDNGKIRVWRKS
jgi:hypothetical protein